MIEFLCGMLGAVMLLGIFLLGYHVGSKARPETPVVKEDPTDIEMDRIRKERERMEQDQAAFRALTNYSADIAYGVVDFPKEVLE